MEVLTLNNEQRCIVVEENVKEHLLLLNPLSATLHITQHAGSEVTLHCLRFPAASLDRSSSCSYKIEVEQLGAGCRTSIYGMAMLQGNERFDLSTHVRHTVGGGFSQQLVKYLLAGHSHGSFYGELVIAKDAQQTEAHQTNRNILLSPAARMDSKPQLEIYADDVKASHGATTGQLDSASLFYMQQRGISLKDARRMLLHAFISDVIDTLPDTLNLSDNIETAFNSLNI